MMYGADPLWLMMMLVGLPLIFLPQWWVKSTVAKWQQVPAQEGLSGAQVARDILQRHGIHDVSVEATAGFLSDHYDPKDKTVRLSEDNYHGSSITAAAIAAHEVGHAIQHNHGFFPVVIRSSMVPLVNLGSQFGPMLIMFSLLLMFMNLLAPDMALLIAWTGVIGFAMAVAFHFVTLPVEIDASLRAVKILKNEHYLNPGEMGGANAVLIAAASTYVATALYSLMQLAYFIFRVMGASNRR
ncbi:MAG: zinc metallopeptidase [Cyanobacteria bacterium HKST-UBA06]|nr:zinc metallopeptidase [Cyanobacteria bacterium HKST-UBA06]